MVDHGVTFDAARDVFKDPSALDWLDERQDYGEDRYAFVGMSEGRLLCVAYTISARLAEPKDGRRYHDDNET